MKKTGIIRFAMAAVVAAATLTATVANAGEADIKYRQSVMKAIGGHMGAMATILKTGAGDAKDLVVHAHGLEKLAKIAQHVFPENSSELDGVTQAKSAIWDKPKEFEAVLIAFATEARELSRVSHNGDKGAFAAQLGRLGKNGCKACHTDFRTKKQ